MGNVNKNNNSEKMERLKSFWKWAYRLRSVILAIPVAFGAVVLAIVNQATLPAQVGINLQANGE